MQLSPRFLVTLLGSAGALHFIKPEPFDGIVPQSLPGKARTYTYASGAAELTATVLLASPYLGPRSNPNHRRRSAAMRRAGGLFSAVLFTAVWPANFSMAWQWRDKTWAHKAVALGRLPLQLPLIRSAWRVYNHG